MTEATVKVKGVLGVEFVQSEFWKIAITTWLGCEKRMYGREFESEEERIRKKNYYFTTPK